MRTQTGKREKGFTLVELIITVAIIGILAAVAIPMYAGYRLRSERNLAWADLQVIRLLEEQFFAENNTYVAGADTPTLQANLPGFNPDPGSPYVYSVTLVGGGAGYTARATRMAGTGTDTGSPWWITETNNRNY